MPQKAATKLLAPKESPQKAATRGFQHKIFHASVRTRKIRLAIIKIKNNNDQWKELSGEIDKIFISDFQNLWEAEYKDNNNDFYP